MRPALKVDGLSLRRGSRALVYGARFELGPGAALQLRGPNGSGKTTLLRALAGFHTPEGGTIELTLDGLATESRAEHIGFMGHLDAIKPSESVDRQLAFWAALFSTHPSAVRDVLKTVGLGPQASLPGGFLSAGQRRRLALARLLLMNRSVWLMDEPAAPLDQDGRAMLGAVMANHRDQGGIIVAAVHDTPPGPAMDTLNLADFPPRQASRAAAGVYDW